MPPPPGVAAVNAGPLFMQHDHIFAPLLDIDCYVKAWQQVRKISGWKDSTQTFGLNLLPNLRALIDSIEAGAYQPDPFFVFQYCERGHHRLIKALSARDRVLHHVLCNNVLIPGLRRFLIYDNGASLSGKGISFARARLECHLHRHMRAHEREGWILLLDFRKFFDNIPHQQLIDAICRHLPSERLRELLTVILHQHETDISYLPDDTDLSAFVLNSVEHHKLPPELMTGRRYLRRGLGVGAPLSQIAGVFYPTPLDNYCKNRLGCRFYARYMDDVYLIHHDKAFLRDALASIREQARALGLFVHPDKTQIVKLAHGFTWLKTRYTLTETGGIVRRLWPKTVTRHRRKLKILAHAVRTGELPPADFKALHRSWLGDKRRYHAHHTISNINKIYAEALCSIS